MFAVVAALADDEGMAGQRVTPRFAELLTLSVQARRDADSTRRALHRRDRGIAAEMGLDGPDRARLRRWARGVDHGQTWHRLNAGWWSVLTLGALVSVALGVGAALALFRYDGSRPVNVLAVLAVFVALPLVTAGLSALGMLGVLPRLLPGRLPGLGGALVWGLVEKLPKAWAVGQTAEAMRGELRRGGKVLGKATSWAGWSVSQALALLFVLSGWVTFMALLATSDLAFGWASTFHVDPEKLRAWLSAALWFHPGVVPDAATVELTVAERAVPFAELYQASPDAAAAFKSWWRPLSWLIVAYGVVPRLLLAVWSNWRMRVAVGKAFDQHPAGMDVLRRMDTPVVEAGAAADDHANTADVSGQHKDRNGISGNVFSGDEVPPLEAATELSAEDGEKTGVIRWSASPTPGANDEVAVHDAGGGCTLEQDEATVRMLADAGGPVRVYVKGWEPPLAEFTDMLRVLRDALGDGVVVDVAVVVRGQSDQVAAGVWSRKLSALGDPWLRVTTADATQTTEPRGGTP